VELTLLAPSASLNCPPNRSDDRPEKKPAGAPSRPSAMAELKTAPPTFALRRGARQHVDQGFAAAEDHEVLLSGG
jgi:hypothetical protein